MIALLWFQFETLVTGSSRLKSKEILAVLSVKHVYSSFSQCHYLVGKKPPPPPPPVVSTPVQMLFLALADFLSQPGVKQNLDGWRHLSSTGGTYILYLSRFSRKNSVSGLSYSIRTLTFCIVNLPPSLRPIYSFILFQLLI